MTRKSDFERSKESPLEFARLSALSAARALNVTHEAINEAFGVLMTVFGADWLNGAAEDVPRGRALPFRRHPIGDLISTAGVLQLAELVELGEYLASLAGVPEMGDVVGALKSSYRQTFFQLALASLAKRAGARIERLEPASEGGRLADIDATIGTKPVRIECFRPTFDTPDDNDWYFLAQQVLEVLNEAPMVLSAAIDVRSRLEPGVRREVVNLVRQLVRDVVERSKSTSDFPAILARGDSAVVSVARGLPVQPGTPPKYIAAGGFPRDGEKPHLFLRASYGTRSEMTGIGGTLGSGHGLSHVALWRPADHEPGSGKSRTVDKELERVGRKLESKLSQARTPDARERVMAVDSWTTRDLHKGAPDAATRLKRKIVDSHRDVAGILLMRREPLRAGSAHEYLLLPLLRDEQALDPDFMSTFSNLPNVRLLAPTG